jgi:DNA-binding LacI/PurR family transcriptional regulator
MASAPEAGKYALVWGQTSEESSLESQALQLCDQYIAQKLSGVFFAPLEMTPNCAEVNLKISVLFEKAHIPVVLLDRCILPFPQRSRHDLIGIDNRRAGYLATEHLIRAGCRHVGFLAKAGGAPTIEARISGFREALNLHGLKFETRRVQRLESVSPHLVRKAIEAANADAFVCANDRTAGEFLHALQELGLQVPGDLRVVGVDDVDYCRLLSVPLTTVHQPCREIGNAAITAMLSRRERPSMLARDILLDCRLVIRKSSGVSAG